MSENLSSDEISLKELIGAILKNKKTIVLITIIILIITGLFTLYQSQSSKSAKLIVSFNFDGIEIHKNPDGTDFNPYQIVSPHVLSNALSSLNLDGDISVNDVRALIEIDPIIPDDVTAMGEYSLEKNGESYTYYPNEYIMTLKINKSRGVTESIAQRIENAIVTEYSTYFNETYLSNKQVSNKLIGFNAEDYDYSDISRVYHSQIDEIKRYVRAHHNLDVNYRSKRTGMSFDDIYYNISLVDEVEMNKLDSLISAYKITKDRSKLVIYYEYLIEQLEYQLSKYSAESDVTTNILSNIEDSSTSIINSISGEATDESNSYFNTLILRTSDLGQTSSTLQSQISYYRRELDDLRNGNYETTYDKNQILTQVDDLIDMLDTDIKFWFDTTTVTTDEFYDKYLANTFYALSPSEVYSTLNLTLNMAIGLVLGLMLGVFVALFKAYWTDNLGGIDNEIQ